MFGFGTTELIILAVIILILFGGRLPKLFRSLGESVPAFKKGLSNDEAGNQKSEAISHSE